jgi:4,4'-diaponeurosporenoate glycosyltransferase
MWNPSVYVALLALLLGFYLMWRIPCLSQRKGISEQGEREGGPQLSIIIPARNERKRITPLLESLHRQTLPPHEILVADDHSTDGTASVAGALGATVLRSEPLPDGWTGKTWACWQAALRASGDLLVFLDADVHLERTGLASLVDAYGERGGLLTVQPYHITRKPYEQLSAMFNIVLMAGLNGFTPQGESLAPSGAFGPCNVCDREDYFDIGGHGHPSVRPVVLESIPLGRVFLSQNLPVRCYGGRGGVSFRMYPAGLAELVEGWSKGFGSGALAIRPAFLLMLIAWISGGFGIMLGLLASMLSPLTSPLGSYALLYLLYALQLWWMLRRIGSFRWWTAALFPGPLIFFALVLARSFVQVYVLGRVQWRGRTVPTASGDSKR